MFESSLYQQHSSYKQNEWQSDRWFWKCIHTIRMTCTKSMVWEIVTNNMKSHLQHIWWYRSFWYFDCYLYSDASIIYALCDGKQHNAKNLISNSVISIMWLMTIIVRYFHKHCTTIRKTWNYFHFGYRKRTVQIFDDWYQPQYAPFRFGISILDVVKIV